MDQNYANISKNTLSWAQDTPIWAQIPQNRQKSPKAVATHAFGRLQERFLKDVGSLLGSKWSQNEVKSHEKVEKATKVEVAEFIGLCSQDGHGGLQNDMFWSSFW